MVHMLVKKNVLIIKLGYSETFVSHVRMTCSLGDVLRTTSLLHLFKEDDVTWLTGAAAVPLLNGNPYIDRILKYTPDNVRQLETEQFDTVVNLEKVPDVCELAGSIDAVNWCGFFSDPATGKPTASEHAYDALIVTMHHEAKQANVRSWSDLLFSMLGEEWRGEGTVLGYKPGTEISHDVGFNTNVGSLFPVKAWPDGHWAELEKLIGDRYTVSYQQCLDDLYGYMDWINSCRALVTNDSLGLHLALALDKKVIGMFGPTPATELDPNDNLKVIVSPADDDCMPCCSSECATGDPCMQYITPDMVFRVLEEML
ncbi:MAG: glycosyltransferase family 9 protein [Kiritimatiellia bacterium]|nr:glycosyltransferase family 9 protein [Kiritimatiellia bacterium]MDP6848071.1 glycosyltransferase family 9 protein [Kiritimatiellia bacterium]